MQNVAAGYGNVNQQKGLYSLTGRRLIGIGIPIINLSRSDDRLRFIMGIPIPIRQYLLNEQRPRVAVTIFFVWWSMLQRPYKIYPMQHANIWLYCAILAYLYSAVVYLPMSIWPVLLTLQCDTGDTAVFNWAIYMIARIAVKWPWRTLLKKE